MCHGLKKVYEPQLTHDAFIHIFKISPWKTFVNNSPNLTSSNFLVLSKIASLIV